MKGKHSVFLTVFVLLFVPLLAFGQQGATIKGVVTDKDGNPLPGANVVIEGTQFGAATDVNGAYTFRVPAEKIKGQQVTLLARFIGYKTGKAVLTLKPGEIVHNFTLEPDVIGLEEIVVVGYGTARKEELTGSIRVVKSDKLQELPHSSFQDALQGTPGLQVVNADGAPGAGIQIRVRGIGSISASNEPLYVVDGIPVISGAVSITDFANGGRSANVLNLINPNDIESIVIAKDAASTAIYGSRGANGVVFITTKGGVAGKLLTAKKPKFDVQLQTGYSDFAFQNLLKPINAEQYHTLFIEGYVNSGKMSAEEAERKFKQWYPEPANTNWLDAITHTGVTRQLNLSAQGGGPQFTYYVSGNVFSQEGVIINTFFDRYSGRVNLSSQLTDRLHLANNMMVAYSLQRGITDGTRWQAPMYLAYLLAPTIPIKDKYGRYYADHKSFFMGGNNPVGHLHEDKRNLEQERFIDNFALSYKIMKGLTFKTSWGFDVLNADEYLYQNPRYGDGRNVGGFAQEGRTDVLNWQHNETLTYQTKFKKYHSVEALLGYEQQKVLRDEVYTRGEGFPHPSLKTLASAANPTSAYSARTEYAFQSYFSRILYNYKEKYFLSTSFRRDGSSRFGPERRWGDFWSFGAGYTISEESFMKRFPVINYMKLRGSFGETGNAEIGNFAWAGLYSFQREYDGAPGAAPSQIGNPFLTWEKQRNFNFGVDFSVVDNRLSGSIERFVRKSNDLLLNRPLSLTTGFRSVLENVGNMENTGWEISLNAEILRGPKSGLTAFLGVTKLKNRVTKLVEPILAGTKRRAVGHDFQDYWLYGWAGVDPENGDPLWYTDSTKTETTNQIGKAVRFYDGKSATPKAYGNFGFTARYGRITVTAQANYQFGNYLYDGPGWVIHGDGRFTPRSTSSFAFNNRWQKPGDKALFPQFKWGGNKSSNARNSSRYLFKGDFIRLKTFKVAYKLPDVYAFRAGMRSVEVYFEMRNYLTWVADDHLYFDPEQHINGIYNTVTPISKTISFGINLGM